MFCSGEEPDGIQPPNHQIRCLSSGLKQDPASQQGAQRNKRGSMVSGAGLSKLLHHRWRQTRRNKNSGGPGEQQNRSPPEDFTRDSAPQPTDSPLLVVLWYPRREMSSVAAGSAAAPAASRGGKAKSSPDAVLAHLAGLGNIVVAPADGRTVDIGKAALKSEAAKAVKLVS